MDALIEAVQEDLLALGGQRGPVGLLFVPTLTAADIAGEIGDTLRVSGKGEKLGVSYDIAVTHAGLSRWIDPRPPFATGWWHTMRRSEPTTRLWHATDYLILHGAVVACEMDGLAFNPSERVPVTVFAMPVSNGCQLFIQTAPPADITKYDVLRLLAQSTLT